MPKTRHTAPSRAIGKLLKFWREERGVTLRHVARASEAHPEPITFDYLSRLERGQLMPSVPKLATLAAVYRRPLSELVDLYEIEELRKLVPRRGSYEMYRKLGIENLDRGEVTKALACFLGALDAVKREGGGPDRLAPAYNNAASAMIRSGRYLTARQYLEDGLRLVTNPKTRARLLDNLAIVHYYLDDLSLADLLSRESCAIAEGDNALEPMTWTTRASILIDLGRYGEAEELMRRAVEEYRKSGRENKEIRWLYNLGYCLVRQDRVKEGLQHLRTAAARAVERGDSDQRAKSSYTLGKALYLIDRKDDAAASLRSALRIARDHNLRNEAFHCAYYLWLIALERSENAEAEDFFEIARTHRLQVQQRSEEVQAFDARLAQPARKSVAPRLRARSPERRTAAPS